MKLEKALRDCAILFMYLEEDFKKVPADLLASLAKDKNTDWYFVLRNDTPNSLAAKRLCYGLHYVIVGVMEEKDVSNHEKLWKASFKAFYASYSRIEKYSLSWFLKHQNLIESLLKAVSEMPDKGENSTTVVQGITVHNGNASSILAVETATRAIKSLPISGISRILYGDLHVLGDVSRKTTVMAQYRLSKDDILLYQKKKYAMEEVRTLIHEFGHRYWNRFASNDAKRSWIKHHHSIGVGFVYPEVGMEIDVSGDTDAKIVSIDKGIVTVRGKNKEQKYDLKGIVSFLTKRSRQLAFPTPYAATDMEEHFCEAFSLYAIGKLESSHKEAFERIFKS